MSLKTTGSPHIAILPGRTERVTLCCADLEHCNTALEMVAQFLAAEMRHDMRAAIDKPTEAYATELANEISLERARELRRMTVWNCGPYRPGLWRMSLADYDLPAAQPRRFEEPVRLPRVMRFGLWWLGFLALIALAVVL